jgi:hypothetical protein
MFIPNDRQNQNNMINDFKNTSFNSDGEFRKWNFENLNSKYGQNLFVKQGSVSYENGGKFILSSATLLQYNLTDEFPKKNISIKLKVNTLVNKVTIELGGFNCVITPLFNGGKINYSLTYEDDSVTTFPELVSYTFLLEDLEQNEVNEYLFYIDNDNNEFYCAVNNVRLATDTFNNLKMLK